MKAVIMAGGEGSRLRPLTCDRPKPLVPVCNRPVLSYILDLLARHGFQEVFLTLGYMPDAISTYYGNRYGDLRLHYVVEESPLGTAGGVAQLREHLNETFLVISGDALTDIDLTALLRFHKEHAAIATLAMTRVENPLEYGVLMTDRRGRIQRFLEKPGWGEVFSDTVNTGIYVLEPEVLRGVPADKPYDFSQHLFPALLRMEAPLYGAVAEGYWCDIGDPAAYLQANVDVLTGRVSHTPPGREVAPGVWAAGPVPEGIIVDGPALIGEGCRIAPGVRLEAGVVLGPGTVVEAEAVLRRVVTWTGVQVGAGATLVGTLVCAGAGLGPGCGAYEGAVIGGNCNVGGKATVAPGVRVWPRTAVEPGARVDTTLVQSPVWSGRLLRKGSLTGRLGAELFPETALRVGTAFASVLPPGGPVVVGSDAGAAASLLKQALLIGALAAGRDVVDVGFTTSAVTEYAIRKREAAGGMHVRAGGDLTRVVFYDRAGRAAPKDLVRKLEQACQRQDFARATGAGTGRIQHFVQAERHYLEELAGLVDVAAIRAAQPVVVVEGEAWPVLYRWLDRLGCRDRGERAVQVHIDPMEASWRLAGRSPEAMLTLELWLAADRGGAGVPEATPIPVTAPKAVEEHLQRLGRRTVRVRQADWQPGDPLLGIARLLEWMAQERLTEEDLFARLPAPAMTVRTVACPWEAKGRVMRRLLEDHGGAGVDLVDGLRVEHAEGWALLMPDPDEPVYHVYTEAANAPAAEALAVEYVNRVSDLLAQS